MALPPSPGLESSFHAARGCQASRLQGPQPLCDAHLAFLWVSQSQPRTLDIFQISIPHFLIHLTPAPAPLLASYLHYHVGPWLRAILAGWKVGGSMESDHDGLLIRGRQVVDDRFYTLGNVQGVLWTLSDLWRKKGLSGLFRCGHLPSLPPSNSSPFIAPLQVAVSLCYPPTQSGTTGPKGAVTLNSICPLLLTRTPHFSQSPSCLSPSPGSITRYPCQILPSSEVLAMDHLLSLL